MRRRDIFVLFLGSLFQTSVATEVRCELRGFSLFAGPDMLERLRCGMSLDVKQHAGAERKAFVFARGRQIGYLEGVSEPFLSTLRLSGIVRGRSGKHRAWVSGREGSPKA